MWWILCIATWITNWQCFHHLELHWNYRDWHIHKFLWFLLLNYIKITLIAILTFIFMLVHQKYRGCAVNNTFFYWWFFITYKNLCTRLCLIVVYFYCLWLKKLFSLLSSNKGLDVWLHLNLFIELLDPPPHETLQTQWVHHIVKSHLMSCHCFNVTPQMRSLLLLLLIF